MKIKRLLGFVAIAVASVGILAACGKDAACLLYTSDAADD